MMRAVAACVCLALAIAIQFGRDRAYPRTDPETQKVLYVRSPEALDRMALGFDALLADIYWIRAIQHYGGERLDRGTVRRYELLYPLLDIATTLDPYFNIAYRFGAIFLSEAPPGGPGRADHAVALLRKGIAAQPTRWQYYHDIAFVHYWSLRDAVTAAEWFRRAAEQPGAPNWLMPVAAAMLSQGNDRASSRFLWQQILGADHEWMRRRAQHALMQLDALDQIDQLERITAQVELTPGDEYSWPLFVRSGRLRGIPVDPSGTPYVIDSFTGDVTVSKESILFPLPQSVEPKRR